MHHYPVNINGWQRVTKTVIFTAANDELLIAHQDMLLDRPLLKVFNQQSNNIDSTEAGPLQCLLSSDWKKEAKNRHSWVWTFSDKRITTMDFNFTALFLPKRLTREVMPRLSGLKQNFAAAGGR